MLILAVHTNYGDATSNCGVSRHETGTSLLSIGILVKITKILKKGAGYFLEE